MALTTSKQQLQQSIRDIQTARQKTSFPVEPLTNYLYNGPENIIKLDKYRKIIANEPLLSKKNTPYQSRQEQLKSSLIACRRFIEIAEERNLSTEEFLELIDASGLQTPLSLNYSAFWTVIEAQGTPEQSSKWLDAGKRHAVIGCYGQTELSHGSNVARLQTTATYDETTEEFIINSPDITSAKWWIGGLGVACTHSALQAQLIVKGKNYGPHIFIVPVRSPIDLRPIKGVTVGDIGPKAYGGFATVDNGYCIFDHVRIPRDNMLMRFAQVSKDGLYSPPVHSKASYGSMVRLRVGILSDAGWKLAKAATIAVRYCTSRRQFNSDQSGLESQVINYSSVRHRLYPLVATAYALIFSSLDFYKQFDVLAEQLLKQDATLLPEMHVNSCAFKIWSTRRSTEGIEEARKAMGGHGFSIFTGVAELYASFVPSNTYEGDNYMLSQQVGRAMLKQWEKFNKGKPYNLKTAHYLDTLKPNQSLTLNAASLHNPDVQLTLFAKRAANLVANLGRQVQAGRVWTDVNMECWDICFAHAEYLLLKQLIKTVREFENSPQHKALAPVIKNISNLFFFFIVTGTGLATFLTTQAISATDVPTIQEGFRKSLNTLDNDTIGLTDAFGFTEYELNSILGKKDGNVYGAFWDMVQTNPINSEEGREEFRQIMKTIVHRGDNLSYLKSAKL